MKILTCGDRALLVEFPDSIERRAWHRALVAHEVPGVVDVVPADRTVLLTLAHPDDRAPVADRLHRIEPASVDLPDLALPALLIPVTYDGPDLSDVARHLGVDPATVVERHTRSVWRVEFTGFMPGFGYLATADDEWDIPRRESPRPRIPAGSVGLAGGYTGVYPRSSPGGWQLIGSTDLALWDPDRDPPAELVPGREVRFVAVG